MLADLDSTASTVPSTIQQQTRLASTDLVECSACQQIVPASAFTSSQLSRGDGDRQCAQCLREARLRQERERPRPTQCGSAASPRVLTGGELSSLLETKPPPPSHRSPPPGRDFWTVGSIGAPTPPREAPSTPPRPRVGRARSAWSVPQPPVSPASRPRSPRTDGKRPPWNNNGYVKPTQACDLPRYARRPPALTPEQVRASVSQMVSAADARRLDKEHLREQHAHEEAEHGPHIVHRAPMSAELIQRPMSDGAKLRGVRGGAPEPRGGGAGEPPGGRGAARPLRDRRRRRLGEHVSARRRLGGDLSARAIPVRGGGLGAAGGGADRDDAKPGEHASGGRAR